MPASAFAVRDPDGDSICFSQRREPESRDAILRFSMRIRLLMAVACVALGACQKSDVKVLIGGTTITAPGAAPIEDSVIVVAGGRIRSVGLRKDVPIPQDSERTDATGMRIVAPEGARIAVNESADLVVTGAGATRRMIHGQWQ